MSEEIKVNMDPLSYKSVMVVQEHGSLSACSMPSFQSWAFPLALSQPKTPPVNHNHEPLSGQDPRDMMWEISSLHRNPSCQTQPLCAGYYDIGSCRNLLSSSVVLDEKGFARIIEITAHDEQYDNYILGIAVRSFYADCSNSSNAFTRKVSKEIENYNKVHNHQHSFEFVPQVKTDTQGNPEPLVNPSGHNPVSLPHGDEKINGSAKSQGKAGDAINEQIKDAADKLNEEGGELSDGARSIINALSIANKSRKKRTGRSKAKSKDDSRETVRKSSAVSIIEVLRAGCPDLLQRFGTECFKAKVEEFMKSGICPICGGETALTIALNSSRYVTSFRYYVESFTTVKAAVEAVLCKNCNKLVVDYKDGMDYPSSPDSLISINIMNHLIHDVISRGRAINSLTTELQRKYAISPTTVTDDKSDFQLLIHFTAECVVDSVLYNSKKIAVDGSPMNVLSCQGKSRESDEMRSNKQSEDVKHVSTSSQPYMVVFRSASNELKAVSCKASLGRGADSVEMCSRFFSADSDNALDDKALTAIVEMMSDGYSVYPQLAEMLDIRLCGCHTHSRRAVLVATNPKKLLKLLMKTDEEKREAFIRGLITGVNASVCGMAIINLYSALFAAESQVRDLVSEAEELNNGNCSDDDRERAKSLRAEAEKIRTEEMAVLLDAIFDLVNARSDLFKKDGNRYKNAHNGTGLGESFVYLLNSREHLENALIDIDTPIHNNDTERVFKDFALNRRNVFFKVSALGATLDCSSRTVIETMKANDIDVEAGLRKLADVVLKQLYQLYLDEEMVGAEGENGHPGSIKFPTNRRFIDLLPKLDFKPFLPVLFNSKSIETIENMDWDRLKKLIQDILTKRLALIDEQWYRKEFAAAERHAEEFEQNCTVFKQAAIEFLELCKSDQPDDERLGKLNEVLKKSYKSAAFHIKNHRIKTGHLEETFSSMPKKGSRAGKNSSSGNARNFIGLLHKKTVSAMSNFRRMKDKINLDCNKTSYDISMVKNYHNPKLVTSISRQVKLLSDENKSIQGRGVAISNLFHELELIESRTVCVWFKAKNAIGDQAFELREAAANCINWAWHQLKAIIDFAGKVYQSMAASSRSKNDLMQDKFDNLTQWSHSIGLDLK